MNRPILTLALAALGASSAPRCGAQPASLKFEVATIKPANPDLRGMGVSPLPGGGFSAQGVNLRFLILYAYGIQDFQLSGGPGWIASDRYDIEAKPEKPDSPAEYNEKTANERVRERLRALLAERFHLALRKEAKELSTYSLVVAKGGPKLTETKPDGPRGGIRRNSGMLLSTGAPFEYFVTALSQTLGRPVVDETGLGSKRFDFELRFAEDQSFAGLKPGAPAAEEAADQPSIFTALQSQLGLKLEAKKGQVDFFVIERAEKPSAN